MALARARCKACTLPLGDPPHTPLTATCVRCGTPAHVPVAADGQPADFDAMFQASRLLQWFAAARISMAQGTPGVALGSCVRCLTPLVVAPQATIALPCPHCQEPVTGTAVTLLVDQWPEPWAKIEGAGIDLEYRLAMIDDKGGVSAGCSVCAMPTPTDDPAMRCRRCNAVIWVHREPPPAPRVQLGVRVNGTRGGVPFKALVPIAQGEAMLQSDSRVSGSGASNTLIFGISGVGCAILTAVGIFLTLFVAFCAYSGR